MKKEDKNLVIEALGAQLAEYSHFYLVNIEGLNAEKTSALRRACFKQDIKLLVAKNTLLQRLLRTKALMLNSLLLSRETPLLCSATPGTFLLNSLRSLPRETRPERLSRNSKLLT